MQIVNDYQRRSFSRKILGTIIALFSILTLGAFRTCAETKPNFIFILADDLGYGDIGPFGSTQNRTPNLDRMAREGMKLTSFYAAPVCTPSRAQILTGCYAKRVSLPRVLGPAAPIGLSSNEHCIAELLKQQGYATIAIGKWHVGDQPEFLPTRHGFDEYFGLPYSNDMGGPTNRVRGDRRPPLPLVQNGQVIETVTSEGQSRLTERYTDLAVKFIREHKASPFFLYLPHTAVHKPLHPGDRFRGKSPYGIYHDWVEEVDWSVGQVLDTVRELGLSDRTLVVFSSDNGPWMRQTTNDGNAGPLRGAKGSTYEGGMREPSLAWWPGHVPAGSVVDAITANFDLLPTFVHLAGGTVPEDHPIDGRDISALLLGRSHDSPHQTHYYFEANTLQAVRSGPWKLAIVPQNECIVGQPQVKRRGEIFTPTLYNLQDDIGERTNVASLHPEIVQQLHKLVAKVDADLGINELGPGVRPPGRVAKPVGLWLPGQAPSEDEVASHYDLARLDQLVIGGTLPSDEAPQIAGKALTISAQVSPESPSGVIVAQGGSKCGYALHLSKGQLVFTVCEHGRAVSVSTKELPQGRFQFEARLARDGTMTLVTDGKVAATGKASGSITVQPVEDFCLGFDNGRPVGEYDGHPLFRGSISKLKVLTE